MTVALLPGALALVLLALALRVRSTERAQTRGQREEIRLAEERGSDRARLQHPHIDLSRCLGCGLCVDACPEEGVLEVVLGQARVVHGARCVGHSSCAEACPVDAIAVTLGDVSERNDLPAIDDELEAVGSPGVFLAGEVTGFALVRTAVSQGTRVAREVARRAAQLNGSRRADVHDLVVVGAGPAGIACSLAARDAGLDFLVIEQSSRVGGTVAGYPRQKMVMTQPMELPLFGELRERTYQKEELVELWESLSRDHDLPMRLGGKLESVEPLPPERGEGWMVRTSNGEFPARNVCLALGRRGVPRKLGVPGEELDKVAYSLLDARGHAGRHVLVVGGGDSAVEAALGLSAQAGTNVTLSYRKPSFFRLKAANERRVDEALREGRLSAAFGTQVEEIEPDRVVLRHGDGATTSLENDDVFVFAGGEAPYELLSRCGISFDPSLRAPSDLPGERGTGLAPALIGASLAALAATVWVVTRGEYYSLDAIARATHPDHGWLRPARAAGLAFGVGACAMILANLAYLVRRNRRIPFELGSLKRWMTVHVATGVAAVLAAALHGGFLPRATSGGYALGALAVLVATGAVGRYLYAFVPRAASGRELALEEVRARLAGHEGEWQGDHPQYRERVRARIADLVAATQLSTGFLSRVTAVLGSAFRLRSALEELRADGIADGVPTERIEDVLRLARRSHRAALAATWYEELSGLMASWRYLHRWVAFAMVLLVALHVWSALRYGHVSFEVAR